MDMTDGSAPCCSRPPTTAGEPEGRAARLTRCYAALRRMNRALVRERDLSALYVEVCRICVETGHARVASVLLLDGERLVRAADAGEASRLFDGCPMRADARALASRSPIFTALREGRTAVSNDFLSDPGTSPWHELARRTGTRAAAALPLRRGGVVAGVLAMHADQAGFFDAALVELLEAMASTLSFALDNLDRDASSAAKSAFLSRLTHELRTPLNAVLGFAQLLEASPREPLGELQRSHVAQIRHAGTHLLALVDDLLDIARIESGQIGVTLEEVDLRTALESALALCEPQAAQREVVLEAAYHSAAMPPARADPLRLRQVLVNLLSNAIKYNRIGGCVRIETMVVADAVQIEVRDTGFGMSGEQVVQLFEPFNRLGRERSSVEGTGIGLALTRQLVQLMGGTIDISSEVDRGTRVCVRLPLAP